MTDTCTVCGQEFPVAALVKSSNERRGYQRQCKPCHNARNRAAQARVPRSKLADRKAEWRARIRKGRCALCNARIKDRGVCPECRTAMQVLGGTPKDLRQAAVTLAYMTRQGML